MFKFAIPFTTDCLSWIHWYLPTDILLKNHILLLFKIYVHNSRKHENVSLNNHIRNVTKVKNIEEKIAGNNEKKIMLITKPGKKNWKQVKQAKGMGVEYFCCEISVASVINYLFILFCFFSLFFVCVCVINFCGSFVILFWCYLITNEINVTKKKIQNIFASIY